MIRIADDYSGIRERQRALPAAHERQQETEQTLRIVIPYEPREQFLPLHENTKRWSITVAHRRAGKTVAEINKLIRRALECPLLDPRFAYAAPTYGQAKD